MALSMLAVLTLLIIRSLVNAENHTKTDLQGDNIVNISNPCSNFYEPADIEIALLTSNNFNENVYNATGANLVQFYSRNCTSCQCNCEKFSDAPKFSDLRDNCTSLYCECEKFYPLWEQLASFVKDLKHFEILKQINCADNLNTQLCLEYKITEYPTIRYFPPSLQSFNIGIPLLKNVHDLTEMRTTIVSLLQGTETESPISPDFSSINSTNIDSFRGQNNHSSSILEVFEDPESYPIQILMLALDLLKNSVLYIFNLLWHAIRTVWCYIFILFIFEESIDVFLKNNH